MRARSTLVFVGLALVIAALAHSFASPGQGRSAKSVIFELLYAPFVFLPNGSGPWLASAFGLGLILIAIVLPKGKSSSKTSSGGKGDET